MKNRIINYLKGKVDVTLAPPIKYKVRNFSVRRITIISIVFLFIFSLATFGFLYKNYQTKYAVVSDKLDELENIHSEEINELERLAQENENLKEYYYLFAEELDVLGTSLIEIYHHNEEVREIIAQEVDVEVSEINLPFGDEDLNLDEVENLGGGFLHNDSDLENSYLNYSSEEIIENLDENLEQVSHLIEVQGENVDHLEDSATEYRDLQAATPSIWPVDDNGQGYITSRFGYRQSPITGREELHEGLDIGVWYYTPVLSTADGVISFAGWRSGYGYTVEVDHGFGYVTRYAHLNNILVEEGQKVKRGDEIALSGNTGQSTGPHLHYEVRINGEPQDPEEYIE